MAEPDEDTCGQEDCVAAVPATQLEAAADGGDAAAGTSDEAVAAAPEGCNSLGGDKERSLDAEEEKRGVFAVKLGGCWDAVSVKLEGGDWAGEGKEKVCSADEEKRGGIAVEFGGHAESNGMATCCVVNGVMGDELLCTPCGEGFGSDDVGCARNTLHDAAEGSQCKQVGLEGEGDDAEVKMGGEDLWTGCEEVRGDKVDLFDSGNIEGEGLTCGAEDVASTADACREVERDDLLLKMDAEVEGPVDEASIPSISGSCIVVSLDCKACRVDDISENSKGMGKSACGSEGGDVLFRKSVFREDCCVEKNQHSRMEILQRMALFKSKEANLKSLKACVDGRSAEVEVSLQLTDQKDGGSEYSPERKLISSSHSQPCEDAPCCSGEELRAQHQSCQDAAGVGSAPSGHVVMELNASNSAEAKACSGSFADNADIGESIDPKPAPLIVFRRRNPKRAASSRNTQNLDKLNMARNGTGKLKKAVGTSSLLLSAMVKFPNKTTKRRSGVNRPLQYPVWGSLQNLIDSFSQNCKVLVSDSDPTWLGNERSKKRSDGKIKPCIRKSRTSRVPKSKFAVFCALGRGKDALSGQPTFPVMADTQASSEKDHRKLIPSLASDVSITASDEAAKASESNEDKNILKIKSVQSDRQQLERDLESTVTQETHSIRGECTTLSASELSLKNGNGTIMLDPGSSPDSVVYNPVLEVASVTCESNTSANHDVVVHGSLFDASSEDGLPTGVLPASNFSKKHSLDSSGDLEQQAKTERVNKSTNKVEIGPSCNMLENHIDEGKVQASEKLNAVRKHKNLKNQGCKKKDGVREKSSKSRSSTKVCSAKASKLKASNHSSMVDPLELLLHKGSPKLDSCFEASTSSEQDLGTRLHEHDNVGHPFLTDNAKQDLGSMTSLASRHKKKNGHVGRKGKKQGSHTKGENKNKFILDNALHDHEYLSLSSQAVTQLAASALNEQSKLNAARGLSFENFVAMSTELPNKAACGLDGASVPPPLHAAWVCCDDCQKWRCIPAELADIIRETNRRWTCKDNEDKAFAGCSIPQEKTNAEINAELELSDASADEACNAESNSRACKPPSWTPLRSNLFLHRNRRTQSIDESMICNCKPPEDGQMGCRDGCLNRILNIECVKRTCPCGYLCSNQQFQRRNYAKLRWFHSGKKGYGLQLRENVSEGQFLIEYVGEVLDITAYESRQRYYASKGQKHFYFMALNGGEVIDACTKGNLGRFINHSCSPNCRTEKWMVNGEVCIGIFATRNIKKGEELTFDYNYVRVSGAAPQKCFCGAAKCRGYIGGDILDAGMIAQGDAEAVYFAPASVDRDTKKEPGAKELSSHDSYLDVVQHEETSMQREDINDCFYAMPKLEPHQQTGGNLSDISSEPDNSLQAFSPEEDDGIIRTPVHVSRTMESSLQHFPLPNNQPAEFLQTTPICVNALAPSRPGTDVKSSTLVSDFHVNEEKKLKHHSNLKRSSPVDNLKDSIAGSKTLLLHKDKTMPTDTGNDHLLGVEGRLNKLLDADGGISKRKDATNGYLKLLLVTAAEGDNAGGTSKSVRDLSLILDALLKTKSHAVLLDIINKNGLQMLHNILKQNRGNFHRTPIIRKLLKVLEFLALKGILTPERINGGPQCAGKESFRDSMMRLTRHNDSQVHQIARNFRDKWMPRTITRSEPTEREDGHLQSHWSYLDKLQMPLANCQHDQGKRESDAVVCVDAAACPPASSSAQDIQGISSAGEPALVSTCTDRNSTGRRKRKSRWDQPSEDHYKLIGLKIQKPCFERTEFGPQIGFMRNKLQTNWETDGPMRGSIAESVDDDVPPGFGSQQECHHFPAQITSESSGVAPGYRQERYQAHLNISYGIPIELVQQFGTPEIGGGQHPNSWRIAPGVPFHPFPPLPPYPQGETCPSTSSSQIFQHDAETITVKHNSSGHYQRSADRDGRAHRNWQNGGRGRWSSDYQGRRIPRQWNNHHRFDRYRPSWPREHVALGSRGRE